MSIHKLIFYDRCRLWMMCDSSSGSIMLESSVCDMKRIGNLQEKTFPSETRGSFRTIKTNIGLLLTLFFYLHVSLLLLFSVRYICLCLL